MVKEIENAVPLQSHVFMYRYWHHLSTAIQTTGKIKSQGLFTFVWRSSPYSRVGQLPQLSPEPNPPLPWRSRRPERRLEAAYWSSDDWKRKKTHIGPGALIVDGPTSFWPSVYVAPFKSEGARWFSEAEPARPRRPPCCCIGGDQEGGAISWMGAEERAEERHRFSVRSASALRLHAYLPRHVAPHRLSSSLINLCSLVQTSSFSRFTVRRQAVKVGWRDRDRAPCGPLHDSGSIGVLTMAVLSNQRDGTSMPRVLMALL
nr:uncharacterized protein LOC117844959 [Setaria viridis]